MATDREVIGRIVDAVLQTIQETPEGAPGGALYLALSEQGFDIHFFNAVMDALVASGKVTKQGDCYFATY